MPPKSSSSKKSAAASAPWWYHCEACDVHITANDRETHELHCPIGDNAEQWSAQNAAGPYLEYIRDGSLFTGSMERRAFSVNELKDMPSKYINHMVFLSEGAMRRANFHIGQQVSITGIMKTKATTTLVRSVWPIPDKFLTTVFVTEEDFLTYWNGLKGQVVQIQRLPHEFPTPASRVCLHLQPDMERKFDETQIKDMQRVVKQELRNLIFTSESVIHINFFNTELRFVVSDWKSFADAELPQGQSLEERLEKLNIDNKSMQFYKITGATHLEIVAPHSHDEAEMVERKPFITKEDIGGLEKQLSIIEETLDYGLGYRKVPKGLKISRGLLLFGPTGCGKSMICEAMSTAVTKHGDASAKTIRINTSELFSRFLGETETNLSAHFERAFANHPRPTLIIVEDVHNLCPKQEGNDLTKRVAHAFLSLLDSMSNRKEGEHVALLATTAQIESLNPSIRRCGRFDCEIEIGAPTPQGRADILRRLLRNVDHALTPAAIEEVAQVTHGYVGADLANLAYNATLLAQKAEKSRAMTVQDVHDTLRHVKPSAMREVLIECPNVRWTDIGGQADLKLKLKQAVEWPLLYPEKFRRLGIKPPRGLLMFGPPGCSKTMIAKALATESQLNFLSIKGPELFSMWVGESERAVREVFRKARQVAPAIVFFDEIDAISSERADGGTSGGGSSVKDRVLTQLLTELDGVDALQDVTVVAATNRPDMIDKALLRPGRFDRIVYVGLPDEEARREIFAIKLRAMPLAADVDVDQLVQRTGGYTGAEIQALCHEAALKTLEDSFDAKEVTWQHFIYALNTVTPRTSPDLLRSYEDSFKHARVPSFSL